jgi:hypothetical protein
MPLTSLTKLQGTSFGNVTATSITSNTVTVSNTTTSQVYAVSLTAGETLAALDAVYLEPTLTQGTAGRVYKMDADVLIKSTQAMFVGFALAAASAAANVNIQISGVVSGFTGLTTGAMYYASSTAGAITATKPLHPLPVGIAISTTQLLINTRKREQEESENVSAIYGYALGGYSGAYVATADRITFSTSATAASTVSNLSQARAYPAGMSDCAVYGYTLGGVDGTIRSTADRTTFSTGATAASTVSNVSQARYVLSGFSDGAVYGYAMGGYTGAAVATADRITFSTSVTAASTISNLSAARWGPITISDGAIYGYALGGYNGSSMLATGDRTAFSTGATAASTISNLSTVRYYGVGVSDNAVYGYSMGGDSTAGPVLVTTADRVTFSTSSTAASTVSNLSQARSLQSGVSDGVVYGYVLGGYTSGGYVATADRITFSTSATAASTTSNLSQVRQGPVGFSDGAV